MFATENFIKFAWDQFQATQQTGFMILVVCVVLGIGINWITAQKDPTDIVVQALIATLFLAFFPLIIEGAKELTWTLEQAISGQSFFEKSLTQVTLSKEIAAKGFWGGIDDWVVRIILIDIPEFLMRVVVLLFSIAWIIIISTAAFWIPTLCAEGLSSIFRFMISLTISLLLIRIPWAMCSRILEAVIGYQYEGEDAMLNKLILSTVAQLCAVFLPVIMFKIMLASLPVAIGAAAMSGLSSAKNAGHAFARTAMPKLSATKAIREFGKVNERLGMFAAEKVKNNSIYQRLKSRSQKS